MRSRLFILVSFCLLLPELLFAEGQEPVLLRYRYPEGKKLIYQSKSSLNMSLPGSHIQALADLKITEELAETRESGEMRISVVFSDVHASVLIGSRFAPQTEQAVLEGRPFEYGLTPRGEPADFVPPSYEGVPLSQEKAMMLQVANLELICMSSTKQFPEHPLKVGDSWTSERQSKIHYDYESLGIKATFEEGMLTISSTYRIKKAKKNDGYWCFEIEEDSKVTTLMAEVFGDQELVTEGSGKVEGKWLFDYERGLTRKYEAKQELESKSTIAGETEQESLNTKRKEYTKMELKEVE